MLANGPVGWTYLGESFLTTTQNVFGRNFAFVLELVSVGFSGPNPRTDCVLPYSRTTTVSIMARSSITSIPARSTSAVTT